MLPIVLRVLPPEHLGMWYVFVSLGGFAALLDFGFEATITRMTAYVWAGAARLEAFGLAATSSTSALAREPNRALFEEILATLRAYYFALGGGVLLILVFGGGTWVWVRSAHLADASIIRSAWLVYALGITLNFVGGRWPALLGGIGGIREAQQVAIGGLLAYYFIALLGLANGWGLWSLVAGMLGMGLISRGLGRRVFQRLALLPGGIPAPRFHREVFASIWPNAWRTGLVSFGAFLIVQANTLVCSAFLGLTQTASYGISFQLVSMLAGLSSVWVQVKLPEINQLRVSGELNTITLIFARRMRLLVLSFAGGSIMIIFLAPLVLQRLGSRTELLPTPLLATMLLIQFLESHHSQYAGLVLSENRNPFLRPALISGLLIILISVILTPRLGVWGLLISAGGVQLAFNNWWPVLRGIRGLQIPVLAYTRIFLTGRAAAEHGRQ